jgi:CO dehydrogenase maturation factor
MPYAIGLAGKGGTGKTTIAGLLIKYLVEQGKTPVLGVDADSNANLNEVLGLEVTETLGEAREEMKTGVAAGMTKDVYMQMKLEQAVVESKDFDLVVMGRPEGAGCYCAANTLLTRYLEKLVNNYAFVVIDNEAGMEHISRLTTNNIDLLLIVSDSSHRGIKSAARIDELTQSLSLNVGRRLLIINQAKEEDRNTIEKLVSQYPLELVGMVPEDSLVRDFDLQGRPTMGLDKQSRALRAAYEIFERVLNSE